MSEIRTRRVFNGLPVDEYIDINTGQIEIRSANFLGFKGDLLAISTGKNWKLQDPSGFLKRYNNIQRTKNKPVLNQKEFDKLFNTDGIRLFNNDRAAILNEKSSEDNRRAFVVKGIPRIKDPTNGKQTNSQGDETSEEIPGEVEQTQDPNSTTPSIPAGTSANEEDGGNTDRFDNSRDQLNNNKKFQILYKYPEYDLGEFGFDYIKIQRFKYVGLSRNIVSNDGRLKFSSLVGKNNKINRLSEKPLQTICLPMQPQLSESNSVDWGADRLNEIQGRLATSALDAIDTFSSSKFGLDGLPTAIKGLLSDIGSAAKDFATDPAVPYAVKAYFAGQAVGANIVSRATGQVLNPNLELLFNGPRLRKFNFNFTFTPRTDSEAKIVRDIIRIFKTGMAPGTSTSNLFLFTPDIFKLEYVFNQNGRKDEIDSSSPHPYMNKFKPCALTDFSVNYTPGNSYMTYKSGSMTQYVVTMTFAEIEPIYQRDQDESFKDSENGGTFF